jgi:hypothetical protein
LVALAKERGIIADHVGWLGKSGWQDHNLVPFVFDNDYIFVTSNRRHFLRGYAKLELHGGLVVIVPAVKARRMVSVGTAPDHDPRQPRTLEKFWHPALNALDKYS